MKLSDFDYQLPRELIAQYPLKERDEARLLVVNRSKERIEHRTFKDITDYFLNEELVILNNTKVVPARIFGRRKSGGKVEIFLLNRKDGFRFEALINPGKLKPGEEIIFDDENISAKITAWREVTFSAKDIDTVYGHGQVPLPPYIKRIPEDLDKNYYQTVYAKEEGAVASPTAGLHFTEELLEGIRARGVNVAYVTLHVGLATFNPVKSENILEHKMEYEYFRVYNETAKLLDDARSKKKRVFAVGTTSCRALEAFVSGGVNEGKTNLFIYPGYKFKAVDALLTNFHLPRTTLLMLVSAFAGRELIKRAYQEAIDKKYRFYSYGDAMLIL